MANEAANRFEQLWKSQDSPPDVFAYLNQEHLFGSGDTTRKSRGLQSDEKLEVLLLDQKFRWQTGKPIRAEEYLQHTPELKDNLDHRLSLIVGEYQAQQSTDQSPKIEDFTSRFSDISSPLREKLSSLDASDLSMQQTIVSGDKGSTDDGEAQLPPSICETFVIESASGEEKVGRYRPERMLGEGAFGRVFLVYDKELDRHVAIKVPTASQFNKPEHAANYLSEAKMLARLDHQNIVPVYDVGRTADGLIFVISKFIEGCTLKERMVEGKIATDEIVKIVASVASGLHHAHQQRIIHRDVKPGNILLEEQTGVSFVADFGLAIREEDYLRSSKIAGTPAYMSPEQAGGEGHRLDGRSDIFSLGIVFYEMLTGKRPFRGSTANELLHQMISTEPIPPSEIDPSIPPELERICLRSLSRRASDRYRTAGDMADDLQCWQEEPQAVQKKAIVHPKGIRSFDSDDADFFLDLLPGPRSRDGLPESIRFWKTRMEERDPDETFRVGLILGPSGCGKSSLMKAGLLPRLAKSVSAIYLEATPSDTEKRLLSSIRKRVPEIPTDLDLIETFAWLRRNNVEKKVVVVLDQFEQWLHSHREAKNPDLIASLRQCDGANIQVVVMVRDDFSTAASRFVRELEIRIVEGHNFATVDLFDIDHARNVLIKFGQGFNRLDLIQGELGELENEFVNSVVAGLAEDGRVVSVRLALFAEMVKNKPWIPTTLQEVGGAEGVGANFLEEKFGSRDANPDHRRHQEAARNILLALLPEIGSDIKGHMRSHHELMLAAGYEDRSQDFNDLLLILDGELRLITPTDPDGTRTQSANERSEKFYQLTHDYLVPSLREWLTRKQKESRRGRVELMLAERSDVWHSKRENRQLPSWAEWFRIHILTAKEQWSDSQQEMMGIANRMYGIRFVFLFGILALGAFLTSTVRQRIVRSNNDERAMGQVTALVNASIDQVPDVIDDLQSNWSAVQPKLEEAIDSFDHDSNERLNLSLALLEDDPDQLPYLKQRLIQARADQIETIRTSLMDFQDQLVPELWNVALDWEAEKNSSEKNDGLLQATSALAVYDQQNAEKWNLVGQRVCDSLLSQNTLRGAVWIQKLKPAREHLIPFLYRAYRSEPGQRPAAQVDRASEILEDYASGNPQVLAELILAARPDQFVAIFDAFSESRIEAVKRMREELDQEITIGSSDEELSAKWPAVPANLADELEDAGGKLSPRDAYCISMELANFKPLAESLRPFGYRPIRVRPFLDVGATRVAACWTRDELDWRLEIGKSHSEILSEDGKLSNAGFVATDVAGYIDSTGEQPSERYAGLWATKTVDWYSTKIFLGKEHAEALAIQSEFAKSGFTFNYSLQAFQDLDDVRKFSSIAAKSKARSTRFLNQSPQACRTTELLHKVSWDIDTTHIGSLRSPDERDSANLAEAKRDLSDDDSPSCLLSLANAYLDSGKDVLALKQLNDLIESSSDLDDQILATALGMRSRTQARLGKRDLAEKDLDAYLELDAPQHDRIFVKSIVEVQLGNETQADHYLASFLENGSEREDTIYACAKTHAVLSGILKQKNPEKSGQHAQQAIAFIRQLVGLQAMDRELLAQDPSFDAIRDQAAIVDLLKPTQADIRYSAIWNLNGDVESKRLIGLSERDHQSQTELLRRDGFYIFALTVSSLNGSRFISSVWHRPLIEDEKKEQLVRRQASAAVAMVRLQNAEDVWPLLDNREDPRLRTWIIERLAPLEVPIESVASALGGYSDSIHQALLLALGGYDVDDAVAADDLITTVEELYVSASDPGVQAAAGWTLSQWGRKPEPAMKDLQRQRSDQRSWFTIAHGHQFVVLPGPSKFLMGSPNNERQRSSFEHLHQKEIDRTFAIGSHEITVEQFDRFLKANPDFSRYISRRHSPEDQCPQTSVTWYEAAAYCRWLSEIENVPEEEMCYPPINEIVEGMKLPRDYLSRTGYRLPTEAEWEYACRANATSSRHYGQCDELLPQFAWYVQSAEDQTWPVGTLKPNAFGLFDMHGNVQEWCQEKHRDYRDEFGPAGSDREDLQPLSNAVRRVLRGGSFGVRSSDVRSAFRGFNRPANRYNNSGLRVARTIR